MSSHPLWRSARAFALPPLRSIVVRPQLAFLSVWRRLRDRVTEYVHDYETLPRFARSSGGTFGTLFASAISWWQTRSAWKQRRFLRRVNLSLNLFDQKTGTLKIRTLFEKDIAEVLLDNDIAINIVLRCANRTTVNQPFLDLPIQDAWHILNPILNSISEANAPGYILSDIGIPGVHTEWYVFGLTCEKDEDVRLRKIRIMMIREALLKQIPQLMQSTQPLRHELPNHSIRWRTLCAMAKLYEEQEQLLAEAKAKQQPIHPCPRSLMRVEIVVASGGVCAVSAGSHAADGSATMSSSGRG